jgi:hypothetical protein
MLAFVGLWCLCLPGSLLVGSSWGSLNGKNSANTPLYTFVGGLALDIVGVAFMFTQGFGIWGGVIAGLVLTVIVGVGLCITFHLLNEKHLPQLLC